MKHITDYSGPVVRKLFALSAMLLVLLLLSLATGEPLPDTFITNGPPEGSEQRSGAATSGFGANRGGGVTYECSVDGGPWIGCVPPVTIMGLGDGEHNFRVRSIKQGKTDGSPAVRHWRGATGAPAPDPSPEPRTLTKAYEGTDAQLLNPERGWWYTIEPDWWTNSTQPAMTEAQLRNIKEMQGATMVRRWYVIDDHIASDIPEFSPDPNTVSLQMIRQDFAAARAAGMKILPAFSYIYNTDNMAFTQIDAEEHWVHRHIDQVAPIMHANKEVLSHFRAGFIGCYGEWHGWCSGAAGTRSRHVTPDGWLTPSGVNIFRHLLAAMPAERQVAFRYPRHVQQVLGGPLDPSEWYSGTDRARVGTHNDSIGYDPDNRGTYHGDRAYWRPYFQSYGAANVVDGEPSGDTPYARANLLTELREDRFDALNMNMVDYANDPLYAHLRSTGDYEVIRKHLGYRFRMLDSTYPTTVARGGALRVDVRVTNEGWGKVFNPREVVLVLRGAGGSEYRMGPGDGRRWLPKPGQTVTLQLGGTVPAGLAPGRYGLHLELRDPLLPHRPEYSIRMANAGTWDAARGYNDLGITVEVR